MLRILSDYSLKELNSFGLNIKAKQFVEYDTVEDLQAFIKQTAGIENILHIGAGNNLLFTKNFEGTILHSAIKGLKTIKEEDREVLLRVGAAEIWDNIVERTLEMGLYGLENLSLIPSETGAAAVQNIGAYGSEAKDFIESVEVVDLADGSLCTFSNADCHFAYRYSNFKGPWRGRYAVTHVILRLLKDFTPNLSYRALKDIATEEMDALALRQAIINVRQSKLPDPKELGNAGSFFMNPVVSEEKFQELLAKYPQMPHFPAVYGVKIPAGWLIEQAGWKGRSLGRAGVYEKQALVLVNLGGAKAEEIVHLAETIAADVEKKFGIKIHPEVNWI